MYPSSYLIHMYVAYSRILIYCTLSNIYAKKTRSNTKFPKRSNPRLLMIRMF